MNTTALDLRWSGACRTADPDLHFPAGESGRYQRQIAQAKSVCAGCPVLSQCREFGMTERHGIWGGLTESERRAIRATEIEQARELERQDTHRRWGRIVWPTERPSLPVARQLFRDVVTEILRKRDEMRVRDVPADFFALVRSRGWVLDELAKLVEAGDLIRVDKAYMAAPASALELAAA